MATRRGRRAGRRSWQRIAFALPLLPLVGLWAHSVYRSAGQALGLLDAAGALPPAVVTSEPSFGDVGRSDPVAGDRSRRETIAGAEEVAGSDGVADAATVRSDLPVDTTGAPDEFHGTADLLPLFAEYLREADAEQALEIARILAEFLPAGR